MDIILKLWMISYLHGWDLWQGRLTLLLLDAIPLSSRWLSSPVIPGSNIRRAGASRNLWDWSFPNFTRERSAQRGAGSCNFGNLHLNQGKLRKRACERGMWAVALLWIVSHMCKWALWIAGWQNFVGQNVVGNNGIEPLSSQSHKGSQEHNKGELEFEDSDVGEMDGLWCWRS